MELFAKLPYDIQQIIYNMKRLDEIEREQRIHHDQLVSLFDRVEPCHEYTEDFPNDDELPSSVCFMWYELHELESDELEELREIYEAETDPRSDDEL